MSGHLEWLMGLGYLGLFIGSFLAATLVPFSADVLLIALLAAGGDTVTSVIVASLGNWAGGMVTYYMGYMGKWEWIQKWFRVKPETLEKQKSRIDKHGSWLAFFAWLPGIGDIMALGLGVYKIDAKKVAIFMLIGKTARFICWGILYHYAQPFLMKFAGKFPE